MELVFGFVRQQWTRWLGHVMRINENDISRTFLSWRPMGKRPRCWLKKKRLDVMGKNVDRMGI